MYFALTRAIMCFLTKSSGDLELAHGGRRTSLTTSCLKVSPRSQSKVSITQHVSKCTLVHRYVTVLEF